MSSQSPRVVDPKRLQALAETRLLDTDPERAFDRVTALAQEILKAPVVLMSLVTSTRQFFKSSVGLPEPWASRRETPLTHSICQYVVDSREPLIICETPQHPLVVNNKAITDLAAIAYLGVPIRDEEHVLGSLCAIHHKPHVWTEEELSILKSLGDVLTSEIKLRKHIITGTQDRERLAASEARLALLLNSTGEGIYGIDEHGICTFFNSACLRILGAPANSDLRGQKMHDLIHHTCGDGKPYHADDCRIRRAVVKGKGVHVDDEIFWRLDGTPFPAEYWSYPIQENGVTTGAVVTFVDITKRKLKERELLEARDAADKARRRAEYADRQKTRFLANVSHEIRTPMNAILGFSELLDGLVTTPKSKQYLSAIRNSGASLLALINDILDLSKIESGKLELHPEPCDLRETVGSVSMLLSQQAAEKNLNLEVDVTPEVPEVLILDRLRLRQILLNLLSNAIKFTPRGDVWITVRTCKRELDERHVKLIIDVRDTGIGIPPAQLDKIFLPFEQADLPPETADEGTGLGLSIALRLARLMGGILRVKSQPGQGSTFTLSLEKVAISTELDAASSSSSPHSADLNLLAPADILIVDDNSFNRELVGGYLEDTHHTAHFAFNGQEALTLARQIQPDIILMDIRMPIMNGLDARIQAKSDPKLRHIPIIAVTASSMKDESDNLSKLFDGYIRKPFSKSELFQEMAHLLPVEASSGKAKSEDRPPQEDAPSVKDADRWLHLLHQLDKLQKDPWEELHETMAINSISRFARKLRELGAACDYDPLTRFADNLFTHAENFALPQLESAMGAYPRLVDDLRHLLTSQEINA